MSIAPDWTASAKTDQRPRDLRFGAELQRNTAEVTEGSGDHFLSPNRLADGDCLVRQPTHEFDALRR